MNTPPDPTTTASGRTTVTTRQRLADRVAWIILERSVDGYGFPKFVSLPGGHLLEQPRFSKVLVEAPQVAEHGDSRAARTARTPRGNLVVVRLHGPDWSLVIRPAQPISHILAAFDDAPSPCHDLLWDINDPSWRGELIQMEQAILAAIDPAQADGRHG